MKTPQFPTLLFRLLLPALAVAGLAASLAAAPKLDVTRMTPVAATEQIPLQDFFRRPALAGAHLNPSGTHLAGMMATPDDRILLMVANLDKQTTEVAGAAKEYDTVEVNWISDTRVTSYIAFRKTYGTSLMASDVDHLNAAYPLIQYAMRRQLPRRLKDPARPLVWVGPNLDSSVTDVGVVEVDTDIRTGALVNLMSASNSSTDSTEARESNWKHFKTTYPKISATLVTNYLGDKSGELEFGISSEDGLFILHRFAENKWTRTAVDLEVVEIRDAGNQPGELVVRGPRQADQPRALQFWDARSNQPGKVLLQDKAYDVFGTLFRDPATREVIGVSYERAGPQVVWFSEEYRALQKMIDARFPGLIARIVDGSIDGSRFLVSTYSDRQPMMYYQLDLKKHSVGLIKNSAPWLDPQRMRPTSILKYKTRGGQSLDAYVTLPAGATKETPAPLVVLCPRGQPVNIGPDPDRASWEFDGEAQFLASRGYAVLRPNHRGCAGYGWMFPYEDRNAFAAMSDDVTDATHAVLKTGVIDATRVGIMGTWFGGYLAVAGAAREPSLYRCAVTITGIYDWEDLLRDRKHNQVSNPEFDYLFRHLGDPRKEAEKFDALSPVRHVDRMRAAVFVAQGKDDSVVPLGQARRLLSELQRNKLASESLFLDDVNFAVNRLEDRVELYGRIEAFLAKNLMAKPAP